MPRKLISENGLNFPLKSSSLSEQIPKISDEAFSFNVEDFGKDRAGFEALLLKSRIFQQRSQGVHPNPGYPGFRFDLDKMGGYFPRPFVREILLPIRNITLWPSKGCLPHQTVGVFACADPGLLTCPPAPKSIFCLEIAALFTPGYSALIDTCLCFIGRAGAMLRLLLLSFASVALPVKTPPFVNSSLPIYGSSVLSWAPPPGGFSFKLLTSPDLNFLFPSSELTTCSDGGGAFCSVTRPSARAKSKRKNAEGKIRQFWAPASEKQFEERSSRKYQKTCIVEQMAIFFLTDSGHLKELYWDWTNRWFKYRNHFHNASVIAQSERGGGDSGRGVVEAAPQEPKLQYISAAFDSTLYALDSHGNLLQRCFDLSNHQGVECGVYGQNAPDDAMWFWRRMNVGEMAGVKFRGPIIPSSLDDQKLYLLTRQGQAMEIHFSENYAKWSTFHAPIDVRLMVLTDGQSFPDSLYAISRSGDLFVYNLKSRAWKSCGNPGAPLALYEGVAVNTVSKQALYLLDAQGSLIEFSVPVGSWRNLGHPQKCRLRTPPSASQLGHTMHFFLVCDNGALYSYDLVIKHPQTNKARWTKHGLVHGRRLRQERIVALASDIVYMMTEDGAFVERSVDGVWNQVASLQTHILHPAIGGGGSSSSSSSGGGGGRQKKNGKRRLAWRWKSIGPMAPSHDSAVPITRGR
eukprot:jgi/Bigna1/81721/fgenesh1_pg.83_\